MPIPQYTDDRHFDRKIDIWMARQIYNAVLGDKYPVIEDITDLNLFYQTSKVIDTIRALKSVLASRKMVYLYGAGKVGRDYYRQIRMNLDYDIVLWVDNNYKNIEQKECVISNPECIFNYDFDVIVVALVSNTQRKNVKDYLMNLGVDESKIMLEKPIRIIA
jgi:FlaA1/EpsC-like NDP-sugar epimerase